VDRSRSNTDTARYDKSLLDITTISLLGPEPTPTPLLLLLELLAPLVFPLPSAAGVLMLE
jgi:hypothetical protein